VNAGGLAFVLLFFGALAVGGAAGGYVSVSEFRQARASETWPVTEGAITAERASRTHRRRKVLIQYEYEVGGRSYESRNVRYLDGFHLLTRRDLLSAYDVGDTVAVSYDPERPSSAALEPGASPGSFLAGLLVSGGFLTIGLYGLARGVPAALKS
jgi:hypothetical protein